MSNTLSSPPYAYQGYHPNQSMQHNTAYTDKHQPPELILGNAFPDIDRATITAILTSTRGELDPAYNALSAISRSSNVDHLASHYSQNVPSHHSHGDSNVHHSHAYAHQAQHYEVPAYPIDHRQSQPPPPPPYYYVNGDHSSVGQLQSSLGSALPVPQSHPSPANSAIHSHVDNINPSYRSSSSTLSTILNATHQHAAHPVLPDVSKLSLNEPSPTNTRASKHFAFCDGCRAEPIMGRRWRCLACADYELCDDCRNAKIHADHRFEEIRAGVELHLYVECDGCNIDGRMLLGTRFNCLKHENEDWCERCMKSGRACAGPFREIKQTDLGRQIEIEGCLPMPRDWMYHLQQPVATYNIEASPGTSNWLEQTDYDVWFNKPKRERRKEAADSVFKIEYKRTKGRMVSDNKDSWVMKTADGTKLYSYSKETDRKTNAMKREKFEYQSKSSTPVFSHTSQMDSLKFEDPKTGVTYRWSTNRPISTLNDERYDFQRYALFRGKSGKEVIVADMCWWDGDISPEDCLTIRDPNIDHAMVIASWSIIIDHQWKIMADQRLCDIEDLAKTEEKARLTELGRLAYWCADDFTDSATSQNSGSQTGVRMSKLAVANQLLQSFNQGFAQGMQ